MKVCKGLNSPKSDRNKVRYEGSKDATRGAPGLTTRNRFATSNKKLLVTSASLVVTSALLVVTRRMYLEL